MLRDRSNGTRGQAVPASAPLAQPSRCDPYRKQNGGLRLKAHGVCEPSSIFIKGGLGTISSSRCQTTRARPGEPGRARIFSNFWTSSARKSAARGLRLTEGARRAAESEPRSLRLCGRRPASANLQAPIWWSQTGSNRRPPACKAGALPTELWPLQGSEIRGQ